jgi:hypothetical protein
MGEDHASPTLHGVARGVTSARLPSTRQTPASCTLESNPLYVADVRPFQIFQMCSRRDRRLGFIRSSMRCRRCVAVDIRRLSLSQSGSRTEAKTSWELSQDLSERLTRRSPPSALICLITHAG